MPAVTQSAPAPVTPSQNAYANPGASKAEIDAFVKANVDNLVNEADPVARECQRVEGLCIAGFHGRVDFGRRDPQARGVQLQLGGRP